MGQGRFVNDERTLRDQPAERGGTGYRKNIDQTEQVHLTVYDTRRGHRDGAQLAEVLDLALATVVLSEAAAKLSAARSAAATALGETARVS